jgi:hypothetical protein
VIPVSAKALPGGENCMLLTPPQFRTLKTVLRYGQEQIEEAESIIGGIEPRSANETGQLARLKEIRLRIADERHSVERRFYGQGGQK